MSISSTVLWFVVLPAVIVVVISALAFAGGSGRRARRYRPGRPYDFTPIWFLAAPEQVGPDADGHSSGRRAHSPALESAVAETGGRVPMGATGGASDRW